MLGQTLNPERDNPSYVVALNLLPASPNWLAAISATPMYLGLDLRGGVHFLLQVDMKAAINKRLESLTAEIRAAAARQEHPPRRHHARGQTAARALPRRRACATRRARPSPPRSPTSRSPSATTARAGCIVAAIKPEALKRIAGVGAQQNITTLHNRVNELGVAEPIIQQQGADRIVVQLPGVQDTARAKEILGRTATLECAWSTRRRCAPATTPAPTSSRRTGATAARSWCR